MSDNSSSVQADAVRTGGSTLVLAIIYVTALFFIWALVTNLLDPLLKTMKTVFTLTPVESMLTGFAFFIAYFFASLPSAAFLSRFGYAKSIMVGLGGIVAGCFIAIVAAKVHVYMVFLVALFVMASGVTLLQVTANPLIASMGNSEGSAFRLNLSQSFNSLGAACGLFFGASFLLNGDIFKKDIVITDLMREAALGFVTNVYLVIGLALALFIFAIWLVRDKITAAAPNTGHLVSPFTALTSKWANLGSIGIFLYVGAEVAISLNLLLYLEQANILNVETQAAGHLTTFYMVFAMIGRFVGSALLKVVKDYAMLTIVAVGAIALCLVVIFTKDMVPSAPTGMINVILASVPNTSGLIPAFAALLIGLFNSIMFPTIFTLTLQRSTAPTSATSGLLCLAIVGGAILPLIFAKIEEVTGSKSLGFIAPLISYVYVLWFAVVAKKAPTHTLKEGISCGH
ncbi:MFS transporter, FHS family, L-fucose permease [Azotobacter beijerinckii]|uniref:MFS transporter, FHS family, L-fucose permease n=1 Tax=Azotobacter beijerinckii TaxID=170623 RepID=A0A1H9SIW5_9GAMM|nr:sugar MFS transporter [Azotobacter beijerinckii]SEJ61951.1 MFS transporter, FHS family, L-fucose permease [Azotobacter beijerinckii]SER84986.1 MFS transporter, FHS family, L-fucose permease [Azotobacter beijerinckii]